MEKKFSTIINTKHVRVRRQDNGEIALEEGERTIVLGNIIGAFPISNRGLLISLRDQTGQEIGLLDDVRHLDDSSRRVVKEELDRSYFMPRILDVLETEEKLGVSTWRVSTNRGERTFQVRIRKHNFRRVGKNRYILKDADGNRYEVKNLAKLPFKAQNIVWEYI